MRLFELSNKQRAFFGLLLVEKNWERQIVNDKVIIYCNGNKILKILNYKYGYVESDTEIDTIDKQIILPKTLKGKQQKLTVKNLLKLKGSGVQFSGSFQGGGISVYDNRRNVFFIKSYFEEGLINTYSNIENWISNYLKNVPENYFEWLNNELAKKRLHIRPKEGDIIAYKISSTEYAFARIILDVFMERKLKGKFNDELQMFHPRSLIITPYAVYKNNLQIKVEDIIGQKALPMICIFDTDVYSGEIPIVGYKSLSEKEKQLTIIEKNKTLITIPYTKTDIVKYMMDN